MEARNLYIRLGQLAHYIADISVNRLVGLRSVWIGHVNLHVLLLKDNAITEHFNSQILIEVTIGAFRILSVLTDVVGDVRSAVRF